MAWEDILPLTTAPQRMGSEVSIAWRRSNVGQPYRLMVTLYRPLLVRMQWDAGKKVRLQRDKTAGLLRISPMPGNASPLVAAGATVLTRAGGAGQLNVRLDGVQIESRVPIEPAPFCVEAGAVVITLPDWAAPERVAAKAKAAELSLPEGMIAEDLVEAIGRIRSGANDAAIRDWLGWGQEWITYARRAAARREQEVVGASRAARRAA